MPEITLKPHTKIAVVNQGPYKDFLSVYGCRGSVTCKLFAWIVGAVSVVHSVIHTDVVTYLPTYMHAYTVNAAAMQERSHMKIHEPGPKMSC